MELSEFAFRLLLLFFPGLICAYIVDKVTIHRPRDRFFFVIQAFVFGVICYVAYFAACRYMNSIFPDTMDEDLVFLRALSDPKCQFSFKELAYVSLIAPIVGVLIAGACHHKWITKFCRYLKVTQKTDELDIWGYWMNSTQEDKWIIVRDFKKDLVYEG